MARRGRGASFGQWQAWRGRGMHGEAGGRHGGARRGLCGAVGREERGWSQIEIAKRCADAKIAKMVK